MKKKKSRGAQEKTKKKRKEVGEKIKVVGVVGIIVKINLSELKNK